MKRCYECRKKLSVLEGYRHPVLGKDSLLCSNCFDTVHDSVANWREAVLPYVGFFNNNSSNENYHIDMKKMITSWVDTRKSVY
jgi:hypothetical protein